MHPRTYLIITVVLINALMATLLGVSLLQSRTQYETNAANTSKNLSLVLEEYLSGTLATANAVLDSTAREYLRQLKGPRFDAHALEQHIAVEFAHLPFNDSLRIADANGIVAHGIGVDANAKISIQDRDYFLRLREHPEDIADIANGYWLRCTGVTASRAVVPSIRCSSTAQRSTWPRKRSPSPAPSCAPSIRPGMSARTNSSVAFSRTTPSCGCSVVKG